MHDDGAGQATHVGLLALQPPERSLEHILGKLRNHGAAHLTEGAENLRAAVAAAVSGRGSGCNATGQEPPRAAAATATARHSGAHLCCSANNVGAGRSAEDDGHVVGVANQGGGVVCHQGRGDAHRGKPAVDDAGLGSLHHREHAVAQLHVEAEHLVHWQLPLRDLQRLPQPHRRHFALLRRVPPEARERLGEHGRERIRHARGDRAVRAAETRTM